MTLAERSSLIAGGLGWMLDAMDVMLYSLVLSNLVQVLAMDKATAGILNSLTLFASALGGFLFGFIADRIGRVRALMATILVYSIASAACGLSNTILQLAVFRFILGLGMGGEWTTGAALVAETWPPEHRGKALGLVQSTWAIGEMVAAAAVGLILPRFGWRAVFFFGVVPALLVFWIRRGVPESEIWKKGTGQRRSSLAELWKPGIRRHGIVATAMNTASMFGYWGLFTWVPAYLSLPISEGGRGLNLTQTTAWLIVMGVGKWLGYTLFGFIADGVGRRPTYIGYLLIAAGLTPLYGIAHRPLWLLFLGPFVAFFGTGFFSGFSAIASEIFPTSIRATAMGISYNLGRGLSSLAPFTIGFLAARYGFGYAFFLTAVAFLLGACLASFLPETRGKQLA
jgi:MFS family permease